MDPHTWPCKSRTISTNIHSATMWGIRYVVQKTCLRRWTIGKSGERGSGISVLPSRHDDDDDDDETSTVLFYTIWFSMSTKFHVLPCITNNSIKHQSFVYTQLNDKTVVFQTIPFNICRQFECETVLFDL